MLTPSGSCLQAPVVQPAVEDCPSAMGNPSMGTWCTHRLLYDAGPPVRIKVSPHPSLLQKPSWPAALMQHRGTADLLRAVTLCANYSAFIHRADGSGNDGSGIWVNLLPLALRSPLSQHIFQQTLPGSFKTPEKAP